VNKEHPVERRSPVFGAILVAAFIGAALLYGAFPSARAVVPDQDDAARLGSLTTNLDRSGTLSTLEILF
jgi:hypothetical protein